VSYGRRRHGGPPRLRGHHEHRVREADPAVHLNYTYGRLPVDLSIGVSRGIAPRGGYQLGPNYKPNWIQQSLTFETALTYNLPNDSGLDSSRSPSATA